jgi:uncharacterized repeat protein (TIGR02543 family)
MPGLYPRGFAWMFSRVGLSLTLLITLLALAVLSPVSAALGASSPGGAVAAAWPAAWNSYRYSDGAVIADNNTDQNPSNLDLASGPCAGNCIGPDSSVLYASDGTTAFFRIRLATDITDNTKGGLFGGAFLTQIAVNDVVAAVVGVDGKSASVDYVYVADEVGGTVNTVYEYPFDSSGGESSAGMRIVDAADGTGQYFLDFQVPLSIITTVSGGEVTASTPIKLYYGSSAAANLATINKDFMAGDVTAVDFSNLATVSLSPAALTVSSSAVIASGHNPPYVGQASSYTVTVTATNPGGGDLSAASVTIPVPAGVTVTSPATATGTIAGSPLVWNIGTMLPGATATATFTATVTPSAGDEGMTMTLVNAQSGTGTDVPMAATRTATAAAIVLGVVTDPPAVPVTWAVGFDSTGGSSVPGQTIDDGETVAEPADPTRSGYTFDGWFTAASGGTAWDFATDTVTAATTLYAQWTAIPPVTWAVGFDSTGGTSVPGQTITDGGTVTEPTDPSRSGYLFDGWFTAASGGTAWDFATDTVTTTTTLYAQWTAIPPPPVTWTVGFDSTGGSIVSDQVIVDGDTVTEPLDPTRSGFTFDGWFTAASGGTAWDFTNDTVTGDTTLYAQWTAIPPPPVTWAVDFNSTGGSSVLAQIISDGGTVTEPTDPTRSGFTFDGWFTAASGGTAWDFASEAVTGDTTLFAQWTAVPPIMRAVVFESLGGSTVPGQSVADGAKASAPTPPNRTGYTFTGWYTAPVGGSAWDFATGTLTSDLTLYARWTAAPAAPTQTAAQDDPAALATTGSGFPPSLAIGILLTGVGGLLLLGRRRAPVIR